MVRTLTAAALAVTLCATALPAGAQAATVEEAIVSLISEKLKDPAPTEPGYLLSLRSNATRYATEKGIAAREAIGDATLGFPMGYTVLTVFFRPDPAAPTVRKRLSCTHAMLITECIVF